MELSHAVEDYLKAIYELQAQCGKVSTTALAEKLKVAPASVTGMIKKLAEDRPRLVNYERHHGVTLTPAGQKIALEVIRHHRLLELYLHEALGYSWDKVDAEAEKLEHVISEDFEDRIAKLLGNPGLDPHGDPIPTKEGTIAPPTGEPLSALAAGQHGRVVRVFNDDPALLRYLAELGLTPDTPVVIVERPPFGGTMHVRVGKRPVQVLGQQITDNVFIILDK